MNQKATFGMGCFWHPDDYFSKLKGVISTKVGYMGKGDTNYEKVCSGDGHTETVEITFDPNIITYKELLQHFWKEHEFETKNKTQYKSAIYYHNKEQQEIAEKSIQKHPEATTELLAVENFVEAEEYHQKYIKKKR